MTPWERLLAADDLVSLVATAIRLKHPASEKLARVTVDRVLRKPDAWILEASERLERWIDSQSPPAIDERGQAAVMLTGGPARVAGGV